MPAAAAAGAAAKPLATSAATRPDILIDSRDGSKIEHVLLSREELEEGIERYGNSARRRLAGDIAAAEQRRAVGGGAASGAAAGPGGIRRRDDGSRGVGRERAVGRRAGEDSGRSPVIAGPFMARSQEDVFNVKKSIMDDLRTNNNNARRSPASLPGTRWNGRRSAPQLASDDEDVSARSTVDGTENGGLGPYHRRQDSSSETDVMLEERQTQAEDTCFVGNDVLSCYPTANTSVTQGRWSKVSSSAIDPCYFQGCMLIHSFHSVSPVSVHLELQLPTLPPDRRSRRLPLPTRHGRNANFLVIAQQQPREIILLA